MASTCNPASQPRIVRVRELRELRARLNDLGVTGGRPVVVLVGGASGMDDHEIRTLSTVLREVVLPALGDGGAVVDGGTDAGVMRAVGFARAECKSQCLLVGVAAGGTLRPPIGSSSANNAASVEPRHTHVVLVPGQAWGDESPWLIHVAEILAGRGPSLTILANGGEIARRDVALSLAVGRSVLVLAGTGRLADEIAAKVGDHERGTDATLANSALTTVVDLYDSGTVAAAISSILT